nr:iAM373=sex pheromone inhibito [Enterococcus faecalis, Peptide, 7 aa] [Enterococcus faecalis]
SIFTLVA